jgi:hypothetical protein
MTETERAKRSRTKALHAAVRADMRAAAHDGDHRHMLLAWAFVRGLPFRRIERSHRVQVVNGKPFEHHMPSQVLLTRMLIKYLPEIEADMDGKWSVKPGCRIERWLSDPSGAIPAPPPRVKRPYVRPVAAE